MVAQAFLTLLLFFAAFLVSCEAREMGTERENTGDFIRVNGMQFVANGSSFHFSGFNAYWLMLKASDMNERAKVSATMRQASAHGLKVCRTWAFSNGGQHPLQYSPGSYNEAMFQGLDFVIYEARKNDVYLLLALGNNFYNFGGKEQYVQWARERGQNVSSKDDFFTNSVIKGYFKDNIKAILTRVNTFTGVAYKDDPTIFGWELLNEPRSDSDPSGATVQAWIEEMAAYVKSIDQAHLLEAGLEGFYGEGSKERREINPWGYLFGTNFIATNQIQEIDFATIHVYPNAWLWGTTNQEQLSFFKNWTEAHIEDMEAFLKKPLVFTEFGEFLWDGGSANTQRDDFLSTVFDSIYTSAANGGPLVGGMFWHLLGDGMDMLKDGYEIMLSDSLAASIISNYSLELSKLNNPRLESISSGKGYRTSHQYHSEIF